MSKGCSLLMSQNNSIPSLVAQKRRLAYISIAMQLIVALLNVVEPIGWPLARSKTIMV
jgi:hypothetical protein